MYMAVKCLINVQQCEALIFLSKDYGQYICFDLFVATPPPLTHRENGQSLTSTKHLTKRLSLGQFPMSREMPHVQRQHQFGVNYGQGTLKNYKQWIANILQIPSDLHLHVSQCDFREHPKSGFDENPVLEIMYTKFCHIPIVNIQVIGYTSFTVWEVY